MRAHQELGLPFSLYPLPTDKTASNVPQQLAAGKSMGVEPVWGSSYVLSLETSADKPFRYTVYLLYQDKSTNSDRGRGLLQGSDPTDPFCGRQSSNTQVIFRRYYIY